LSSDRRLDAHKDVFLIWCRLVEKGKSEHHTFPQPELFMAATAILHDLCVVTRNAVGFRRTAAVVLNPWVDCHPRLAE
jgi:predicted nucleic acid-binding protein